MYGACAHSRRTPNAYKTNDLSTWCRQHCIDVRLRLSVYAECIPLLQSGGRVSTPLPSQRNAIDDDLAPPNVNAVSKQNLESRMLFSTHGFVSISGEETDDGPKRFSSMDCDALQTVCSFTRLRHRANNTDVLRLLHSQSHIKNHTLYATAVL